MDIRNSLKPLGKKRVDLDKTCAHLLSATFVKKQDNTKAIEQKLTNIIHVWTVLSVLPKRTWYGLLQSQDYERS